MRLFERFEDRSLLAAGDVAVFINLFTDNGGVPGSPITNDTVLVGQTFFVEVTFQDTRPEVQGELRGIVSFAIDVGWHAASLEEVDDPFDPTDLNSPLLPVKFNLFRQGTLNNPAGEIIGLGGGGLFLSGGQPTNGLGVGAPARFSLMKFQAEAPSGGPQPFTIVFNEDLGGALADGVSLTTADITIQPKSIRVREAPGILVTPTSGLVTTEAGGQATFTVVLLSQPDEDVTIDLASSNTAEGTVSTSTLVFTSANWNVPQTVTVTGVDDFVDDGDQAYFVLLGPVTSDDPLYAAIDPDDVALTNEDDDTAGILVTPTSGLVTTEAGGQATFTVVLTSEPVADVTIDVASSDTTEGTVSVATLTFTAANWNVPQTVTVTGVDDFVDDGDQAYFVLLGPVTSDDPLYAAIDPDDVALTNLDDDTAGILVTPTSGLVTTEAGGQATFTVVLTSEPLADVTIDVASGNPAEGTVSTSTLVFTSANWNVPQTVTVTGVDDFVDDGDQAYFVLLGPVTSDDPLYAAIDPDDVAVTNEDDDTAGILVTPTSGLVTTEAGGTATFTVVLTSEPVADVTIDVASGNLAEGTVSTSTLVFTSANWNVPRTVTVTGVDDFVDDGDQAYFVLLGPVTSDDPLYAAIDPDDVAVTNEDDDTAGILVTPTSGLVTTEAGGQATFTVVLTSEPTADVTIDVASGNPAEGTVSTSTLVFTSANWNVPQTVTVTGVDDFVDDGDQAYFVLLGPVTSDDPLYAAIDPDDVALTNLDDDTAGILVTPTSGLVTTEAGGQATFTVVLTSEPVADVTIDVASSNPAEGTVSTSTLVFTSANWNVPQTVTVTGVDDFVDDGDQAYFVLLGPVTSDDPLYAAIDPDDVAVTNEDDDTAGILVTPTSGLVTTEAGGQATFTVVLTSEPLADVTIDVASGNLAEGTVSTSTLVFTSANWNVPQTVTVTGVDDFVDDGDQAYFVLLGPVTSDDPLYAAIDPDDVALTNLDDDTAGILVTPTSGLVTTEAGGQATFTVVLTSEPVADVTIDVASSDTTEGTVSMATLTFTAANWNVPQTVTVTGVDDFVDDGDQAYFVLLGPVTSDDPLYAAIDPDDVALTNLDDDTAGILVTPTSGLVTTEAGGQATFTVVLTSEPLADVTIDVASSDTTEGTVSVATLTFTAANWNVPRTVTVTGVDDFVDDGDQAYFVLLGPVTSDDPLYAAIDPDDVALTNEDDDTAGILVTPTSGLVTTEAGGQATFTVVLTSEPLADVTIDVASGNPAEGTVSTSTLVFTSANWNVPRTVTVTGVDDFVDDGDQAYFVLLGPVTSDDPLYAAIDPDDVAVTNEDDDTAGILVTPTSGLVTTEAGGQATFTVVLTSEPLADVTIDVASGNPAEGTVSTSTLVFTSANWNVPQTVTVTGVDDFVDDGDQAYFVLLGPVTSDDPLYAAIDPDDVALTNLDDDTAGILVTPTSGLVTTEAGGQATFTVVLTSEPTADVTIDVASGNPAEGTVSTSTLVFTSANWNVPQTVTVTGVDDFVDDGDQAYFVLLGPVTSDDPLYAAIDPDDVALTNLDDDTAGILVTPTSGLITTEAGGTATFTVVLTSEPTADVAIDLASGNPAEGTVSTSTLVFTSATWNVPQTVTVTGVDDFVDDGDQAYFVLLGPVTSDDPLYAAIDPDDVALTNLDDDTAGILVTPTSGLVTTEAGGTATFTVVLTSEPLADVTIDVASGNPAEGTVSTSTLVFTSANWNVPQTVTVTGVDDFVDDGDQAYFVLLGPVTSDDPLYAAIDPDDVAVTNEDDDTAGILVTPTSGLVTTEAGGQATFTVVLTSEPVADVTIDVASGNPAEGTVSTSTLVFTSANWNVPRTVTVTGVDDFVDDGDQAYFVLLGPVTSDDPLYAAIDPDDVAVTNEDDDTAGILVTPTSGLVTTEAGGQATFTVVLTSEPVADVTIDVASGNPAEGTVSTSTLVFTSANWNVPRTVTVTGVDDFVDDGDQAYFVLLGPVTSDDPLYAAIDPDDVALTNLDDDTAGILVTPTSGLVTTEAGGQATFTVVLTSEPVADVTIDVASGNPAEGTVSTSTLVFTSANWNVPRTVTVTGVDDFVDDGDQAYFVLLGPVTSDDPLYAAIDPDDVALTNLDDDTAGILVTPTSGLVTTEAGGQATFTVVLTSEPLADVTIDVASGNPAEGTVSTSTLVFTSANWNVPQTVTVTGVDDFVDDGDQAYFVLLGPVTSDDPLYAAIDPDDVALTNEDDDTAGILVTPTSGLVTTEAGGTATFTVVLTSEPLADVTIDVASGNPAEGTVSTSTLVFTSANWNVPQTVTVTGVDDFVDDGDQAYFVLLGPVTSDDPLYAAIGPDDVAVTNEDDDTAGILVTPTSGLVTTEAGGQATFTVVLTSEPVADVTIDVASGNPAEGTVSTSTLVFTSANWNVPQTVTVTGVDDSVNDGDVGYQIVLGPIASGDALYAAIDPPDVSVTNLDDDLPQQQTAAVADAYCLPDGVTQLVVPAPGVLGNDAGASLTATLLVQARFGVVVLNADGSFSYTPGPDFASRGMDRFTYRASGPGGEATAEVVIENQQHRFVTNLYRDVLDREGEDAGVEFWYNKLRSGATRAEVAHGFVASREYREKLITSFYQLLFGRTPTAPELAFWRLDLEFHGSEKRLLAVLAGSVEYFVRNGANNAAFLAALYRDLLGRAIDPDGEQYWSNRLAVTGSRFQVAREIISSVEFEELLIDEPVDRFLANVGWYQDYLKRNAEDSGRAFWLNELRRSNTWRTAQIGILASAEYYRC